MAFGSLSVALSSSLVNRLGGASVVEKGSASQQQNQSSVVTEKMVRVSKQNIEFPLFLQVFRSEGTVMPRGYPPKPTASPASRTCQRQLGDQRLTLALSPLSYGAIVTPWVLWMVNRKQHNDY